MKRHLALPVAILTLALVAVLQLSWDTIRANAVTITTLNATDTIANSRVPINNNFANLNAGKIESITLTVGTSTLNSSTSFNFVAGSNVTLTPSGTSTITIASTGGGATSTVITISGLTTSTYQILGSANQVTVATSSPGTITLSLPQDVHTAATPTFAGLFVTGIASSSQARTPSSTVGTSTVTASLVIGGDAIKDFVGTCLYLNSSGVLNVTTSISCFTNNDLSYATSGAVALKADKTITISAGTGLSGGGDLSSNRTLTNIGVTTAASGTGVSVSNATGAVSVSLNINGGSSQDCGSGNFVRIISPTGTVTCAADSGGAGGTGTLNTSTAVTAGYFPKYTDGDSFSGTSTVYASGSKVFMGGATSSLLEGLLADLEVEGGIIAHTHGGTDSPLFNGFHSSGTFAAPTSSTLDDNFFFLGGRGYGGGAYGASSKVAVIGQAGENWTGSAQGAYLTFETTANGNTTRIERVRVDPSGQVGIGTSQPSSTLHVLGSSTITTGLTLPYLNAGVCVIDANGRVSTGTVALATQVSGVLPTANGGTGQDIAGLDANTVPYMSGGTIAVNSSKLYLNQGTNARFIINYANGSDGLSGNGLSVSGNTHASGTFSGNAIEGCASTSTNATVFNSSTGKFVCVAIPTVTGYVTSTATSALAVANAGGSLFSYTGSACGGSDQVVSISPTGTVVCSAQGSGGSGTVATTSPHIAGNVVIASTTNGFISTTSTVLLSAEGNAIDISGNSIAFDPTEQATTTWGADAAFTWTFNVPTADTTIAFAAGRMTFSTSTIADLTTTRFTINSEQFTDLTGTGLAFLSGALTNIGVFDIMNATGSVTYATSGPLISNITRSGQTITFTSVPTSTILAGYSTSTPTSLAGRSLTANGAAIDADAELYTKPISISLPAPTSSYADSGEIAQKIFETAGTLTYLQFHSTGGSGTSTIEIQRRASSTPGTAGTVVATSTCGVTPRAITSFTTSSFAVYNIFNVSVSSSVGTPDDCKIVGWYTVDD